MLTATVAAGYRVIYDESIGLQFVEKVVEYGWNVCLFDFGGSGISEGDYISLGHY